MVKRKRTSKIKNVIDALDKYRDLKSEIDRYFHFDSQLWRAIETHIGYAEDCALIEREAHPIMTYRGTGAAVHLRRAYVYSTQYPTSDPKDAYDPDYFAMDIEVEYHDRDEDRTYTRTYCVKPPKSLEVDFTEERFLAWVEQERITLRQRIQAKLTTQLESLIKKNPELAATILKELTTNKKVNNGKRNR